LAAVVRDANDSVTIQDFAGHILAWNERATKMYGYGEEEAFQLNANTLIPDEERENMRTLLFHACSLARKCRLVKACAVPRMAAC